LIVLRTRAIEGVIERRRLGVTHNIRRSIEGMEIAVERDIGGGYLRMGDTEGQRVVIAQVVDL